MMTVSETAASKIKEIVADSGEPDRQLLRISFSGHGWGGPKLGIALDEQQHEDDLLVESNGIKVVFSKDLEGYVNGLALDYSDTGFNKGFRLTGGGVGSCWSAGWIERMHGAVSNGIEAAPTAVVMERQGTLAVSHIPLALYSSTRADRWRSALERRWRRNALVVFFLGELK